MPNSKNRPPRTKEFSALRRLSGAIIHSAFEVYSRLGPGFREQVYVRALASSLVGQGIRVAKEKQFQIMDLGNLVGTVRADLQVERLIVVEIKASKDGLSDIAQDQTLASLKASGHPLALLINFHGAKLGVKRFSHRDIGRWSRRSGKEKKGKQSDGTPRGTMDSIG